MPLRDLVAQNSYVVEGSACAEWLSCQVTGLHRVVTSSRDPLEQSGYVIE